MIKIKRVRELKDAKTCGKLTVESLESDFPYKRETILMYQRHYGPQYFGKKLKNKQAVIFGSYDGKKLVGFAHLSKDEGGVANLHWLIVRPEYRRMGIGAQLIKRCEKWLLEHKYHYLYLFTEAKINREVFYPRNGFKFIGVHEGFLYGENEYIFAKKLAEPFKEIFKVHD